MTNYARSNINQFTIFGSLNVHGVILSCRIMINFNIARPNDRTHEIFYSMSGLQSLGIYIFR